MTQQSIFDGTQPYRNTKPLRLVSLFSGYDSQALALKYLGIPFEHFLTCEWAVKSIQALKDLHFADDNNDYSAPCSFEELVNYLTQVGISANYNEPMTHEQIKHMGEKKCRQVFNNIVATNNMVNIQQAHIYDKLDTDKYAYLMTYSFPCQDLSKAGKGAGMEKGSGTRSGMLWEVERMLDECVPTNCLPQLLLMENVPDVIGTNNIKHFAKWLEKLESLGYKCYWKVLRATDYGIPQSRERCYMVSILGDYYYEFPEKQKLTSQLKDLLETNVGEEYNLSDKAIEGSIKTTFQTNKLDNKIPTVDEVVPTLCARDYKDPKCVIINGERLPVLKDTKNYIQWKQKGFFENQCRACKQEQIAGTCTTQDFLKVINGGGNAYEDYTVRKLTPREYFRLMGVHDEDFDKVAQNQSNTSLYHLAGDSIVVDVLMAIFKNLFK